MDAHYKIPEDILALVISLGETKTRKEGEEHVTRVLKESLSIPIS